MAEYSRIVVVQLLPLSSAHPFAFAAQINTGFRQDVVFYDPVSRLHNRELINSLHSGWHVDQVRPSFILPFFLYAMADALHGTAS